jgi:hypothetical protein
MKLVLTNDRSCCDRTDTVRLGYGRWPGNAGIHPQPQPPNRCTCIATDPIRGMDRRVVPYLAEPYPDTRHSNPHSTIDLLNGVVASRGFLP